MEVTQVTQVSEFCEIFCSANIPLWNEVEIDIDILLNRFVIIWSPTFLQYRRIWSHLSVGSTPDRLNFPDCVTIIKIIGSKTFVGLTADQMYCFTGISQLMAPLHSVHSTIKSVPNMYFDGYSGEIMVSVFSWTGDRALHWYVVCISNLLVIFKRKIAGYFLSCGAWKCKT